MAALDTNILVRWLTSDHAAQCAVVEARFQAAIDELERCFVPVTVVLEIEWVLRSRYRFERNTIASALDALLGVAHLEFEAEPAVERALWLFKQDASPDFADCLHIGLAGYAAKGPLLTFDINVSRLDGAQLLGA